MGRLPGRKNNEPSVKVRRVCARPGCGVEFEYYESMYPNRGYCGKRCKGLVSHEAARVEFMARLAGRTFWSQAQMGRALGISRQRASQLCKLYGLKLPDGRGLKKESGGA